MNKPIKLTNSPVIQSVLSFIVKHILGKPEVEEMISKDPEAPNLRKDDFFLDGPKYKEGLIKHQVQPIYDLLIDKLTPGQLKKIAKSHHEYSREIKEVHFNEVAISVGNYIKDRLWWAPLINSFLANKVKDCLEEFRPYVMKPSPQSEDNNIPNDSYGLSVENSENLEEKIDQVSTRLSSLEVTGAELCWIPAYNLIRSKRGFLTFFM